MPNFPKFPLGVNYLTELPKERLFQLFVDGSLHYKEQGDKQFELREPGCMRGFYQGFALALNNIDKKLDVQLLLDIHKAATEGVTGEFRTTHIGRFRKTASGSFHVLKERCTKDGIHALYESETSRKEQLKPPAKLIAELSGHAAESYDMFNVLGSKEIDVLKIPRAFLTEYVTRLYKYSKEDQCQFYYHPPLDELAAIALEAESIVHNFNDEIQAATTKNDIDLKLLAIVRCAKRLELLHSFGDANGRVFVNTMLNILLMQQGFPPATFYEPNIFDLYSDAELVDAIKDGMSHTLFSIQHPNEPLFGYKPSGVDPSVEVLQKQLMRPIQISITAEEYLEHQKMIHACCRSAWGGKYNLYRACALGDMDWLSEMSITEADIKKIAPDHLTPLYRGCAPLHIACRMNKANVVNMLLGISKKIVNQKDLKGNTPLHYAVEMGDEVMVNDLLKNGADISILNDARESVLERAAMHGSISIFKKIYDLSKPRKMDSAKLIVAAAGGGNLDVLDWLDENRLLTKKNFMLNVYSTNANENPLILTIINRKDEAFKRLWRIFTSDRKATFDIVIPLLPYLAINLKKSLLDFILASTDLTSKSQRLDYDIFLTTFRYDRRNDDFLIKLIEIEENIEKIYDASGKNLLHLAVTANRPSIIKALLPRFSNADMVDHAGYTALQYAALTDNDEAIHVLCESGLVDVNFQYVLNKVSSSSSSFAFSTEGKKRVMNDSALTLAVDRSALKSIDKLLQYGAMVTEDVLTAVNESPDKEAILAIFQKYNVAPSLGPGPT